MKFCEYGPRTLAGFSLARKYLTIVEKQTITNTVAYYNDKCKRFYKCGLLWSSNSRNSEVVAAPPKNLLPIKIPRTLGFSDFFQFNYL
jgi:hypothetical protein